jgi:hypothetical protein
MRGNAGPLTPTVNDPAPAPGFSQKRIPLPLPDLTKKDPAPAPGFSQSGHEIRSVSLFNDAPGAGQNVAYVPINRCHKSICRISSVI